LAGPSCGPSLKHYLENPISGTRLLLPCSPPLRWLLLDRHDAVDAAATPLEILTQLSRAGGLPERLPEYAAPVDMRLALWRLERSAPFNSPQRRKLVLFFENSLFSCLQ